jgi:hypothetical protein
MVSVDFNLLITSSISRCTAFTDPSCSSTVLSRIK